MKQVWLGTCVVAPRGEAGRDAVGHDMAGQSLDAIAAIHCDSREGFEKTLLAFLADGPFRHVATINPSPMDQWLLLHQEHQQAVALARAVYDANPVELCVLRQPGMEEAEFPGLQPYLLAEHIDVEPLDMQLGVDAPKSVPDALRSPLFGAPRERSNGEATAGPGTYAILDGTKVRYLPQLLESAGVAYRSLFQGQAEADLRDVAPVIVELPPEARFTRALFTSAGMPSDMWDCDPGIFVRSRLSLEELRAHFRKFTRLYSEQRKTWQYFRFYDPEILRTMIARFNAAQFEKFGKDISALGCRAPEAGFLIYRRRPRLMARGPRKAPDRQAWTADLR